MRMIKTMILFKRKPDLSHEEFVRHYEEVHAPLGIKCLPNMKGYVRNHIITAPGAEKPDLDCITEVW
ncbi:EthD domain-containing protein [Chloroflexota bacterium]